MVLRLRYLLFLLLVGGCLAAQNLVPNPSFETYTGCPAGNSAISNGLVANWNRPPGSIITPDLFTACTSSGTSCTDFNTANNCVGSSTAFQGTAYAGMLWYYTAGGGLKEYIQAQLTSLCLSGTVYRASYRTKLGSQCRYGTNRLGLYISATAVGQASNQPILVTPTVERTGQVLDKVNWTPVSGTFTSNGTERYITIGNFYSDANTSIFNFGSSGGVCIFATGAAYYMVDSVVVRPAVPLPVDVVHFGGEARMDGDQLSWEIAPDIALSELWLEHGVDGQQFSTVESWSRPDQAMLQADFLHGHPAAGANYYRLGWADLNGDFSVSEVVKLRNNRIDPLDLTLFPNPSNDQAAVSFTLPAEQTSYSWSLVSATGAVVMGGMEAVATAQVGFSLVTADLAAGVYLLQVQSGAYRGMKRVFVGH